MAKKKPPKKQKPQKKKNASQKTNKTVQMREHELRRLSNRWTSRATELAMSAFLITMHDKEGYGPRRLSRVWKEVEKLMAEIEEGRVDVYDLKKTLEEELGVYISREEPDKIKKEGG